LYEYWLLLKIIVFPEHSRNRLLVRSELQSSNHIKNIKFCSSFGVHLTVSFWHFSASSVLVLICSKDGRGTFHYDPSSVCYNCTAVDLILHDPKWLVFCVIFNRVFDFPKWIICCIIYCPLNFHKLEHYNTLTILSWMTIITPKKNTRISGVVPTTYTHLFEFLIVYPIYFVRILKSSSHKRRVTVFNELRVHAWGEPWRPGIFSRWLLIDLYLYL